jgi:uncharacterized protein (TIGR00288 family)
LARWAIVAASETIAVDTTLSLCEDGVDRHHRQAEPGPAECTPLPLTALSCYSIRPGWSSPVQEAPGRPHDTRKYIMRDRIDAAPSMAVFCDFENVALGVRDANYDTFDIGLVLERLLDKGNIVVKKAYADWDRYKAHKKPLHEAAFELVEVPHVSYSGKNSADIRLVVDALDLCYTKTHIDMFVVVSGDSDFSPLVSKLRENNKKVIGLGVKSSTSDLLIDNCDEFIYYDDLVREKRAAQRSSKTSGARRPATKDAPKAGAQKAPEKTADRPGDKRPSLPAPKAEPAPAPAAPASPADGDPKADLQARRDEAIEMVLDTVESLFRDRDDNLWGSMVKQVLKRKKPNFSETFHGYRTFNELLEDAQKRGLLDLQKDERSGGYLILSFGPNA